MKKYLFLFFSLLALFLISCVSAKSTTYSVIPPEFEKVFIVLDTNKTTISGGGYLSYANNSMTYVPNYSSDALLNTVKNKVLIQTSLQEKGYKVVNDASQADIILMGGYETNEFFTDVILAFYNKDTNDLLFTAEGRYGLGLDIQMDVNGALKKALEQVSKR